MKRFVTENSTQFSIITFPFFYAISDHSIADNMFCRNFCSIDQNAQTGLERAFTIVMDLSKVFDLDLRYLT